MTKFVNSLNELIPSKNDLTLDRVIEGISQVKIYKEPESQSEYSTALAADFKIGEYKLSVSVWEGRPKFVQNYLRNLTNIFNSHSAGWIILYQNSKSNYEKLLFLDKQQNKRLYKHMERQFLQQTNG